MKKRNILRNNKISFKKNIPPSNFKTKKKFSFIWLLTIASVVIFPFLSNLRGVNVYFFISLGLLVISYVLKIPLSTHATLGILFTFLASFFLTINTKSWGEYFSGMAFFSLVILFVVTTIEKLIVSIKGHDYATSEEDFSTFTGLLSHKLVHGLKVALNILIIQVFEFCKRHSNVFAYAFIGYLALLSAKKPYDAWQVYQKFIPPNNWSIYIEQTGKYLLGVLILLLIGGGIVLWKTRRRVRLISLFLILYLSLLGHDKIIDSTTKFRDEVLIWNIKPSRVTLWDEVTIKGRNFQDLPWQGKVFVSGVEHRVLKWTNSEIVFQAEPGKTKSGEVIVTAEDGRQSDPMSITVEAYDFFTKENVK